MDVQKILEKCDHTLLKQAATWQDIQKICDEGMRYHTASVCIPPCYVKRAVQYVQGKLPICTVVGFPNGYNTTAAKLFETTEALRNGAAEIDMVINIGELKAKNYDYVLQEIRTLHAACLSYGKILKVIIETCLLTQEEIVKMCEIVTQSGAEFIKTSTGFSTEGATRENVALMCRNVGKGVKVKAAGGIRNLQDAEDFLALGADRLGTSRVVKEVQATEQDK